MLIILFSMGFYNHTRPIVGRPQTMSFCIDCFDEYSSLTKSIL